MGYQKLNDRLRGSRRGILVSKGVGIREKLGLLGNLVSLPHHGVGGYLRFYSASSKTHIYERCTTAGTHSGDAVWRHMLAAIYE